MNAGAIDYATSRASERQLFDHLVRCDVRYDPPLSARVDIAAYARKLRARAETLEAWHGGDLVGVVAIYVDAAPAEAFVSSVSVDDAFSGRGIGSRLVGDAIALARSRGNAGVSLEVSPRSRGAIQVYEKHGFRTTGESPDTLKMYLPLSEQAS